MTGTILINGLVCDVKAGFVKVKLLEYDGIVTSWLPIIKPRAMNDDEEWLFETNEQVVCIMQVIDGSICDYGYCLGAINSDEDTPQEVDSGVWMKYFSDGSSISYDKNSHTFYTKLHGEGAKWKVSIEGGADVQLSDKISLKAGGETLKNVLSDLLDAIKAITVNTAVGPSSVPVNLTAFNALQTRITNLLN
jgi:phage baseplate assembly protein V